MVSLASCQEKQGFGLRCGELEKQVCSGQGCGHGHLQVVFPKEGGWRERELWSRPGSWQEEARYRRDGQLGCRRGLHANMSHSSMWHCLGALLGLQLFGTPWVPEATCFHHLWALETVHPGTGLSLSCLDHLSWWAQSPGTGDPWSHSFS